MVIQFFFLLSFFWIGSLCATKVELIIPDGDEVVVGESFNLRVVVSDADEKAGGLKIKGLENFTIHGSQKSTSIALINSSYSKSTTYDYSVTAERSGTYHVGPASIKSQGKIFKSNVLSITVGQQSEHTTKKNGAIEAYLYTDKTEIVAGESVVLVAEFHVAPGVSLESMTKPEVPGVIFNELGDIEQEQQIDEGKKVLIVRKKYLLSPEKPGSFKIPGVQASYLVAQGQRRNSFFDESLLSHFMGHSLKRKHIVSNEVTIQVSPLPEEAHNVDAIGAFTNFTASVDRKNVESNEPFVLTLTIMGHGDFEKIAAPRLKLGKGAKYFDSKSTVHYPVHDLQQGEKVFEYILQQESPGSFIIPSQVFRFFDTKTKEVKELATEPCEVVVQEIQKEFGDTTKKTSDNQVGEHQSPSPEKSDTNISTSSFIPHDARGIYSAIWHMPWWLFYIVIVLILIGFYGVRLKRFIMQRSHYFLSVSMVKKKKRERVKKSMLTIIKAKELSRLYPFFIDLIADLAGVDSCEVDDQMIESFLREHGFSEDKIAEFVEFFHHCAQLRFSRRHFESEKEIEGFLKKAEYWIFFLIEVV